MADIGRVVSSTIGGRFDFDETGYFEFEVVKKGVEKLRDLVSKQVKTVPETYVSEGGGMNVDSWSDTDLLLGLGSTPGGVPALPRSAYFEGVIDLNTLTISGDAYEKHDKTYTLTGRSDGSEGEEYDAELKIQLTPFVES